MSTETSSRGSFLRNVAIVVVGGVVAAVLFNLFAAPRIATWFFSKTPVEEIVELDEKRTRATRKFATSFLAGLIGPAVPPGEYGATGDAGRSGGGETASGEADGGVRARGPRDRDRAGGGGSEQGGAASPSDAASGGESSSASGPEIPEQTPVYTIDRRELNGRLENPDRMRSRIVLVSNRKGPKGLRVVELEGYYGNFGLHRGDVVVAINGEPVPTRQRAIRVLMQIRRQTAFRVKVHRGGETFEIRYEVPRVD